MAHGILCIKPLKNDLVDYTVVEENDTEKCSWYTLSFKKLSNSGYCMISSKCI